MRTHLSLPPTKQKAQTISRHSEHDNQDDTDDNTGMTGDMTRTFLEGMVPMTAEEIAHGKAIVEINAVKNNLLALKPQLISLIPQLEQAREHSTQYDISS